MARAIQKEKGIPSGDYSESWEGILAGGTLTPRAWRDTQATLTAQNSPERPAS